MRAQNLNSFMLKIYKIIITIFLVINKVKRSKFFETIFLLIDISINIAFGIFFLTLSNIKINFINQKFS